MKVGSPSTVMNHYSIISATKSDATKGIAQSYCTPLSTANELMTQAGGCNLFATECSSSLPSPFIRKESLSSQPEKYHFKSDSDSPVSPASHGHQPKSTFSRSSVFCTSLYESSKTNLQLGNLPFLPVPPTFNQSISAADSMNSPLLFSGNSSNHDDDDEQSEALMKDFINFPADTSQGGHLGLKFPTDNLVLTEQELQYWSDELDLDMSITGHIENPRVDVSMF